VHGYSASPAEVLPLARYLHAYGLTVYVVRLRGHGTSPYDLRQRCWQDWYASVCRGYTCLQALSEVQFAGGMSTGGALALYLAAQGVGPLQGVFAVGTPVKLQHRMLRLAPMVQAVRDFVRAAPENPTTNYTYHPLPAVRQLTRFIAIYQEALPQVTLPVLLIQARGDPTVHPESAQRIYERLQSQEKHLLWQDSNRHVIVGEAYPKVHHDILTFVWQHSPLAKEKKR
jgi:esterase/lipase